MNNKPTLIEWIPIIGLFVGLYKHTQFKNQFYLLLYLFWQMLSALFVAAII